MHTSSTQTDANQTHAERVASYRRMYVRGIGRSPSYLRYAELERACELDMFDEARATPGMDPVAVVRIGNAAAKQRKKLTWLRRETRDGVSPDDAKHARIERLFRQAQEALP